MGSAARHAHPQWRHTPRHAAPADPRATITNLGVGFGVIAVTTLAVGPVLAAAPSGASAVTASGSSGVKAPDAGGATVDGARATGSDQAREASAEQTSRERDERAAELGGRVSRDAQRQKPTPKPTPKPKPPRWVHPMPAGQISSCYGQRWGVLHAGLDLAAPAGTPIRAAGAGRVVSAGWSYSGYGISVMIDHGNGYLTHYAHMSKTVVHAGQRVGAGQIIGREGSTGDSTGPHLHFEVHKGQWRQVNPSPWLRNRGIRVGC